MSETKKQTMGPPFTFAPSWEYAPAWAQWVAMNPSGEWWWWSVCPQVIGQRWDQPEALGGSYVMRDRSGAYQTVGREDWSISLMPRPVIGILLEALIAYRDAIHFAQDKHAFMAAIKDADEKAAAAIAKATGAAP